MLNHGPNDRRPPLAASPHRFQPACRLVGKNRGPCLLAHPLFTPSSPLSMQQTSASPQRPSPSTSTASCCRHSQAGSFRLLEKPAEQLPRLPSPSDGQTGRRTDGQTAWRMPSSALTLAIALARRNHFLDHPEGDHGDGKVLLTNVASSGRARPPWLGRETRAHQLLQEATMALAATAMMKTDGPEIDAVTAGTTVGPAALAALM